MQEKLPTLKDQIPHPPVEMVMSQYYDIIVAISFIVLAGVAYWMGRDALRQKTILPVLILVGAAIASLLECIFDTVVLVWWAQYGHVPLYRIFNISVPLWMIAAYPWYIGGMGYAAYKGFKNGMPAIGLWKLYFLGWIANLFLEIPPLQLGDIYTYYGPQPLSVLGFPLWMAMTNTLMPILVGVVLYALDDVLKGWRVWFVIPIVPMAVGAAEIAAGWPVWLALNSGQGYSVTYAAAAVTLGLSLTITYLISLKCCTPKAASAT